jgi:cytochrome c
MRRIAVLLSVLLGFVVSLGFSAPSMAEERGSKDEAVALVKRAIAHAGQVGIEKALPEFNDKTSKWVDRDLYLIIVDKTGNRIAHGQNVKMIGKSMAESVDVNGKAYGVEVMDVGFKQGAGWVDYYFTDPLTKRQAAKSAYVEKSGDYLFVCGVYKP